MMICDLLIFDAADAAASWTAVDDRVMGGVSHSGMRYDVAGYAVFEGTVSLDRNGGFASVRSKALTPLPPGFPRLTSYLLEVQGDGKRYKLTLRTDDAFDGISYQAPFEPPVGVWTTVTLPLSAFTPSFRGQSVPDAPALDPARVCQVGLMIADRQDGDFALALRAIRADASTD